MNGNGDKSVERALGDLEGTVRAQTETIKNLIDRWARQDAAATEGRKRLYERFETLSNQVAGSSVTLAELKKDFDDLKEHVFERIMPTINAYNLAAAHRAGMWVMSKLFWAGILAICTVVGYGIHEMLQYLHKS